MKLTKTVWMSAVASVLLATSMTAHAETKKELVQKLIAIQQPSLEATARGLTEAPARQLVAAAQPILVQAVPPEKRDATAKLVDAEIKKYLDAAGPIVRASTNKLSQSTITKAIEDKFTEDELKQLIAIIESPVNRKFQQLGGEMQKSLTEKLVAETKSLIEPKIRSLDRSVGNRLGIKEPAAARAPAAAASK